MLHQTTDKPMTKLERIAAQRAQREAARAAFVEDVEWLLDTGETNAEAICLRLQVKPDALQRTLYRLGRHDLAARVQGVGHLRIEAAKGRAA